MSPTFQPSVDGASTEQIVESTFSGAELRVGGINRRGLLQPLLPPTAGTDPSPEEVAAASAWLERRDGDRVEVTGELASILSVTAAARSIVVVQLADRVRYLFGCLGTTDRGGELRRVGGSDRWLARRGLGSDLVWDTLAALPGAPARSRPDTPDPPPPPPELLDGTVAATVTFDGVHLPGPDLPMLQQRLGLHEVQGAAWLVTGARQGEGGALSMAPRTPGRLERAVMAMLLGWPVVL